VFYNGCVGLRELSQRMAFVRSAVDVPSYRRDQKGANITYL